MPLLDRTQLVTTFCSSKLLLDGLGVRASCEDFLLDGVLVGVLGVGGGPS
jgi:hypothetical protein